MGGKGFNIVLIHPSIAVEVEFWVPRHPTLQTSSQGEGIEDIYVAVAVEVLARGAEAVGPQSTQMDREKQHHAGRRRRGQPRPPIGQADDLRARRRQPPSGLGQHGRIHRRRDQHPLVAQMA